MGKGRACRGRWAEGRGWCRGQKDGGGWRRWQEEGGGGWWKEEEGGEGGGGKMREEPCRGSRGRGKGRDRGRGNGRAWAGTGMRGQGQQGTPLQLPVAQCRLTPDSVVWLKIRGYLLVTFRASLVCWRVCGTLPRSARERSACDVRDAPCNRCSARPMPRWPR